MSFIVTREWIKKYTTNQNKKNTKGVSTGIAINASQAKILGLEWTDIKKGWIEKVDGFVISDASKHLFELLKGVRGKNNQRMVIDSFKYTYLKV